MWTCGTSGGVWGFERGYCLMIGGEARRSTGSSPIFAAIAPGVEAATDPRPRPASRAGPSTATYHCGPNGAGHFVKMVHNGIEYGMMAAYAEGLNILKNANVGACQRESDAETAPLEHPEHYHYDIDLPRSPRSGGAAASSPRGCSTSPPHALHDSPTLDSFSGRVSDSGEGRWTAIAAIEEGVPAPS